MDSAAGFSDVIGMRLQPATSVSVTRMGNPLKADPSTTNLLGRTVETLSIERGYKLVSHLSVFSKTCEQ